MTPEPLADLDVATLAVRDLIGASRGLVARMAKVMQMNATDMSAIGELTQHGPLGTAELAERLGIRSASATVLVDRLERSGHVRRVRETGDRRRVRLTETPAARRDSFAAWAPVVEAIDEVARSLSGEERATVCDFLAQVTAVVVQGGASQGSSGKR